MKADLRISVKDNSRGKNLKVLLYRVPGSRQFFVRMNGQEWPKDGRPVSLSRIFAALRKAVARSGQPQVQRPLDALVQGQAPSARF